MIRTNIKSTNCHIEQFFFVVIPLVVFLFKTVLPKALDADLILRRYKIIPDVIDEAPKFIMDVSYRNNILLEMGNKIDPVDMHWVPKVKWPAKPGVLFTLLMVDPDVNFHKNSKTVQRQHWIVGNIPGCDFRRGETIIGYMRPVSPKYSVLHRTIFLVYSQKSRINFTEPHYSSQDRKMRIKLKFNVSQFVNKYFLRLHAVNFARTGWPLLESPKDSKKDDFSPANFDSELMA